MQIHKKYDIIKKRLTNESGLKYTESLKTVSTAFTPRQRVFFMPMAWTRAENKQYQPEHLLTAFSESTPLLILRAFLKKVSTMTKYQIAEEAINQIFKTRNALQILLENSFNLGIQKECEQINKKLATLSIDILDAKSSNLLFEKE